MPQFQLPGRPGSRLSPFQIIILGFAGIILTGALLLMTPFAAAGGRQARQAPRLCVPFPRRGPFRPGIQYPHL